MINNSEIYVCILTNKINFVFHSFIYSVTQSLSQPFSPVMLANIEFKVTFSFLEIYKKILKQKKNVLKQCVGK